MANETKISKACRYLAEKHNAEFASTYGEPGYTDPTRGIIFANWNNIPKGLAKWIESCGYGCEWSDEWAVVDDKAWRTQPDCYGWEPSVLLTEDGEYLTRDDDVSEWIEYCADDRLRPTLYCLPSWIDADALTEAGFRLYAGDLQSGHHPGQTDNPVETSKRAFAEGAYRVAFRKVENSQFYVVFECWADFCEELADEAK